MIAIVDDDESVCRALTRLIRSADMEAKGFGSAAAFFDSLIEWAPDCLVLDVQMPATTGLDLQGWLNRAGYHLPIIFITAHEDETARERALVAGAVAFLRKPISDDVLLRAIELALRRGSKPATEAP